MRIGIYGLGRIGVMHARNLAEDPRVDEIVLIGRDETRLNSAHGAVSGALQSVAAGGLAGRPVPHGRAADIGTTLEPLGRVLPTLDGVVVATSTITHSDVAIEVAASETPLLIEKPLCLSSGDLIALSDRLEATATPIMVAFHRRYDPAYQQLRERISAGEIGQVRIVRSANHDHFPLPLPFIAESRGIWRDLLIHDFDITPWVVGQKVIAVHAFGSVMDEPEYARHDDADTAVVVMEFESGAIATMSGTRRNGAGQDCRLEVFGSAGTLGAGVDQHTPVTSTDPGVALPSSPYTDYQDRFEPAFRNEIAHFIGMVQGDVPSLTPPRAGLVATRIAEAAGISFATGRRIALNDFHPEREKR
jgi:myo-inositol 2-dehydrogenase/D-chiro-inositol 1-dehydrogenase